MILIPCNRYTVLLILCHRFDRASHTPPSLYNASHTASSLYNASHTAASLYNTSHTVKNYNSEASIDLQPMNVKALISCQKFVLSQDVLRPQTVDAMHGGETTVPRKRLGSRRTEQTSLVAIGKTPPAGTCVPRPCGVGTQDGTIRVRDRSFLLVDADVQGQENPIEVPPRALRGPMDE